MISVVKPGSGEEMFPGSEAAFDVTVFSLLRRFSGVMASTQEVLSLLSLKVVS